MTRKPVKFNVNPLLSGPSMEARARSGSPYRELNVTDIDVDPDQPRREFEQESLAELSASIKQFGVLCPILVRVAPGGTYKLIAGERRLRACKLLGKETIPAVIDTSEEDAAVLPKQLVENLQREDINVIDRAIAIGRLRDKHKLSVREIASQLGLSKSYVQRSLDVLGLPQDLQEALAAGAAESKILLLAQVSNQKTRQELLLKLNDLTREQLEREVQKLVSHGAASDESGKLSHSGTRKSEGPQEAMTVEDRRIADEIQRRLGTKVLISRTKGKEEQGKVIIDFYSPDDLGEIYKRLTS